MVLMVLTVQDAKKLSYTSPRSIAGTDGCFQLPPLVLNGVHSLFTVSPADGRFSSLKSSLLTGGNSCDSRKLSEGAAGTREKFHFLPFTVRSRRLTS